MQDTMFESAVSAPVKVYILLIPDKVFLNFPANFLLSSDLALYASSMGTSENEK